jgi:hypothetical protein
MRLRIALRLIVSRPLTALLVVLVLAGPLAARTITLTAEDCDRMACTTAKSPRSSLAFCQMAPGVFDTAHELQLYQGMALLIRFPLDAIPKGQRITKAELTVRATNLDGNPKLHVCRVLAEWGAGVCHRYRMTYPQKLEWATPGARGAATDRAARDTALIQVQAKTEYTVDVTEDIELWYTGAAPNRGWVMDMEGGYSLYLPSPYSPLKGSAKEWKLRITYEPQ